MLAGVEGRLRVCTVLLGGLEGLGEDEWWEVFTPSSTPIFLWPKLNGSVSELSLCP